MFRALFIAHHNLLKLLFLVLFFRGGGGFVFAHDHRDIDDLPRKDPKELIKETTVSFHGNDAQGGSGVIVKKENNTYSVLTAAHVVCNKNTPVVDTDELEVGTSDEEFHGVLKVICPPILKSQKRKSSYCSSHMADYYPWPIDLAIVNFRSENKYQVAKRQGSIKRLGRDVYVAGFPFSKGGLELFILESEGHVGIPPYSIDDTCKGYGIRYVAPTEKGMSGGGVWSKNGRLLGIHGFREKNRKDNVVLNRGSYGTGIHLPYWKQMVDPFDPSKGFPVDYEKTSANVDVPALISRARSFINIAGAENRNNNPNLRLDEFNFVLENLKKAEQLDSKQAAIPALISQVYIRKYEDGYEEEKYLIEALSNINRSIRLYKRRNVSYDGSFEQIRAYIHFLRGNFYKDQQYFRKAIIDIESRLSAKPDDVGAWRDKAKYYFHLNELRASYESLIEAEKYAPQDPSIPIDIAIVLTKNKQLREACSYLSKAKLKINEGTERQGQGAFEKDYEKEELRLNQAKEFLGC
tara:strand:- start:390 stop:1952 length:1563 start_codon:yes stop_codon:yes gene_type:complete